MRRLGAPTLPGSALSIASAAAFCAVLGFLLSQPLWRVAYVLPFEAIWLAGPAAVLAGLLLLRTARRPGPMLARVWVLVLAFVAAGVAVLTGVDAAREALAVPSVTSLLGRVRPWLHATAVAAVAAILTLLPRLIRVHPLGRALVWITPLSLLLALFLVLPASLYSGRLVVAEHEARIDAQAAALAALAGEVRAATGIDWADEPAEGVAGAAGVLAELELGPATRALTVETWTAAGQFGLESDLNDATAELIGAVDRLARGGPLLSGFGYPAVRLIDRHRWEENARFPPLAAGVGLYHQAVGRLFAALLAGRAGELPPEVRAELEASFEGYRARLGSSWTDHWLLARIPTDDADGPPSFSYFTAFNTPLVARESGPLRSADIGPLLRLSLGEARSLLRQGMTCRGSGEYTEGRRTLERLDCDAFAPSSDGPGAELRIQLRVVYDANRPLRERDLPVELYFLMPVPGDSSPERLRHTVMEDLHRLVSRGQRTRRFDRGSLVRGFELVEDRVLVHEPEVEDFTSGRKYVALRVERRR